MAGLLVLGVNNHVSAGTTTEDFLTWEKKNQDAFLVNSISMIAVVATQVKPTIASCINDWYFDSDKIAQERNAAILKLMPEYKEYDPQAVILAYVENACGIFKQE